MTSLADQKNALRKKIRAAVKKLSGEEISQKSALAAARLKGIVLWQHARTILFYAPLPDELDVWPLLLEALAGGKRVFLPRFDAARNAYAACEIRDLKADLQTGHYGIREPAANCPELPLKHLDLMLVPGVAFDPDGWRLGRGRGYYDQILGAPRGPACGIAFDEQIVEKIPVEAHDVRLEYVVTPSGWPGGPDGSTVLK